MIAADSASQWKKGHSYSTRAARGFLADLSHCAVALGTVRVSPDNLPTSRPSDTMLIAARCQTLCTFAPRAGSRPFAARVARLRLVSSRSALRDGVELAGETWEVRPGLPRCCPRNVRQAIPSDLIHELTMRKPRFAPNRSTPGWLLCWAQRRRCCACARPASTIELVFGCSLCRLLSPWPAATTFWLTTTSRWRRRMPSWGKS